MCAPSKIDGIGLGGHGHGKDGGDHLTGTGSHLKIDAHDEHDPDLLQRSKDARALANEETCGDPIDMATGQMILAQTDVDLPGILPLALRRTT